MSFSECNKFYDMKCVSKGAVTAMEQHVLLVSGRAEAMPLKYSNE